MTSARAGGSRAATAATAAGASDDGPSAYPRSPQLLWQRRRDMVLVERASATIESLGRDLDERLRHESRPSERLQMIRAATNQITRTANDAIQAYARASRSVRAELNRPGADVAAASDMRARLDASRAAILEVLEIARGRYATAEQPADGTVRAPAAGAAERRKALPGA